MAQYRQALQTNRGSAKLKHARFLIGRDGLCEYHAHFFDYPSSLTGRHIAVEDIYRPDKDDRRWPMLSVQPRSEVFWRPYIRVVINGVVQRPKDAYKDKDWGAVEAARRFLFADNDAKPRPGLPNRLSTAEVIHPDGSVSRTVINESSAKPNIQQTGAFVLWKGFGKKKIRKSQRMRPQGWHGNHPEQKPHERWGTRETFDDLPLWAPPSSVQAAKTSQVEIDRDSEEDYRAEAIAALDAAEDFAAVFGIAG